VKYAFIVKIPFEAFLLRISNLGKTSNITFYFLSAEMFTQTP